VLAQAKFHKGGIQLALVIDAGAAAGGEVAILGAIDAFLVFDRADQFGNQEIEVHVALAVGMADHVDRHPHDQCREVAAMVEVEAAQEILVGLAITGMLSDHHARYDFHDLGRAEQWSVGQLPGRDRSLAGRFGDTDQVLAAAADGDFLQRRQAGGNGRQGMSR